MKKLLILGICLLGGCAALRGQTKYNGTGNQPTIRERIVHLPEMPKPGMRSGQNDVDQKEDEKQKEAMANYWTLPVDKVATVLNPLNDTINAHVDCVASFPDSFDVVVPPHTAQDMLFTTNAQHMYDTLCQITSYTVNGTQYTPPHLIF